MNGQTVSVCGALALLCGCIVVTPGVLDAGDDVDETTGEDPMAESADSDAPMDTGEPEPEPEPEPNPTDGDGCSSALDILVVIDNSGSMSAFQRRLADSFPLLIDGLDQAGVDWRLAFTTTDMGNDWCPVGTTTPERGRFVFSPCTSRLGDFLFGNNVDSQAVACTDICQLEAWELEADPTFTEQDMLMKSRPWLQRENGQLNVAADAADAIRCLLPQGVNGCGFESQLESMRTALARTTEPDAPETGFMREDASLLIVLVTDEADCSSRQEYAEELFSADGNKTFWSDPDASYPTSAVCWNAGVECSGDPSGYDDCVAVNKDIWGDPTSPATAVLLPVSRYQSVLSQIEAHKRAVSGDGLDVAVLAITGVGLDGSFKYADVGQTDPEFQDSFGIGPGCTDNLDPAEPGTAVPPVRIREVAGQLSTQPFASICAPSFDQHMLGMVEHFVGGC